MAQHTLCPGMKTLGVVSAIVLTVGLAAPVAFADDKSDKESRKIIVLTGDHVGPNTLGLDTSITEPSTTNGVGNQDLFSDDLRYKNSGEVAGRNSAVCITTSPFGNPNDPPDPRPAFQGANLCTLGFVLFGRGKITVSGIVTNDDFAAGKFELPIIGGTDEFRHAQGEFELKFAPVFTDPATMTFRLK
jgi:hypothetical protein